MGTRLKQVSVVLRWVIGATMLSLFFGGIAVFPAYAFGKGLVTTIQNQPQHDVGKLVSHSWKIVPSPKGGSQNILNAVAAVSPNDIWAVGNYVNSYPFYQTLIEQWNGTSWSIVSSPNIGTNDNSFNSVAVVSSNDVWAVGEYANSSGITQTFTQHWNGTNWSVVSSPHNGTLFSVAIVSTNDVWAVGYYANSAGNSTLAEHWNGTNWSVVSSPNVKASNYLKGVTAISTNNIWAVGYVETVKSSQTLIEHYS